MSSIIKQPTRVIVYIDGFNFYFGLRDMGWKRHYWLDYPRYASNLVTAVENSVLVATKYFTARIKAPADKAKRQGDYLDALERRGNIQISYGDYKRESYDCSSCKRPNFIEKEKQTDVSIAVELLMDAVRDAFDVAILISGDSDLVPAIKAVKEIDAKKKLIPCFPPKRHSNEIKNLTTGRIYVTELDLRNSQLPNEIPMPGGFIIRRPAEWREYD